MVHGYYGSVETGWLEVITGVMFSGKSSELIRRVERAMIADQEVLVFKPSIDNRYSDTEVATHNGITVEAQIVDDVTGIKDRIAAKKETGALDVVAIDEGQFFSSELVSLADELAKQGLRVVIAGLDTDFAGRGFAPLPELMARGEYVTKLHAVCVQCSNPATRNQRLIDGQPARVDDPVVVVGAEEQYEARCRRCHEVKR
ncbi:thymidine kinase [Halanaerobaculum tunisiense]